MCTSDQSKVATQKMLPLTTLLFFLLLCFDRQPPLVAGADNYTQPLVNYTCSNVVTHNTPNFQQTLSTLLQNISSQASSKPFHYENSTGGSIHASFLCRGDISDNSSLCHDCVTKAMQSILNKCPNQSEAVIWYEQCMLRFSTKPYYRILDLSSPRFNCNVYDINDDDVSGFDTRLKQTLSKLSVQAAESDGMFATEEFDFTTFIEVYNMEECTPDLTAEDCRSCLKEGIGQLVGRGCKGKQGGRVLFPSCNIRFETYRFYKAVHKKNKVSRILKVVGISVGSAILVCCGVWFGVYWRRKADQASTAADMDGITTSVRSLQFELSMIKTTTHNFSFDRMLGRGGFGTVYKGRLENGQEVAIKRLSGNSVQGIEEFKTEVALVAKLQHRNLVKLLGFCLSRKEKILVYEFLSNSSLDKFLLDPAKRESLDWATRFKIVLGIAKGLLYLHHDSPLKIIHRDLKSSNILLDETLNPKISDFGLARLLGVDETQAGTNRIVGTYGYMAPEYAMTGHFSVKSDVYSFGIIVLELVSGRVNRFFNRPQLEEALLLRAWRVWEEDTPMELVDACLGEDYSSEEVTKCIHISLLCIQADPAKRPDMSTVLALLSSQSTELPPVPPSTFNCTPNLCLVGDASDLDHTQQAENQGQRELDQAGNV